MEKGHVKGNKRESSSRLQITNVKVQNSRKTSSRSKAVNEIEMETGKGSRWERI